jgi:DNA end-binding protein Ku
VPRPVWNGTISFGLVNIPVKLYNCVKRTTVRFHQLRKSDGCRISYKKVCSSDGEELGSEQLMRGYEISPERFIVVTTEELDSLYPEATRSIEIEDFVSLAQIDPVYYEQSFYLVPDQGAAKSYALLLKAMENAGKVGIARFVLRNKEYLAALRPTGNALTLSTMVFHEELVAPAGLATLSATPVEPADKELKMAIELIHSLSADFEPLKYPNDYQERLSALIAGKTEDEQLVSKPRAAEKGKVIDIMAALEASLAAAKKQEPAKSRSKKRLGLRRAP